MEFKKLLSYYRERADLTKTGLAERLKVTPTYIMEVEAGRKPAPNIERCHEIANILNLSVAEKQTLIDAAVEERLSHDVLLWLTERDKKYASAKKICTDEILEALTDPVAVKALLATYQSKEDIKAIIQSIIENVDNLSKEQRKGLLRYCQ